MIYYIPVKITKHEIDVTDTIVSSGGWFLKKLWCCVGGEVKHENLVYQQS